MIRILDNPPRSEWPGLVRRASDGDGAIAARVAQIISEVRTGGDAALRRLSASIDGFAPEDFEVGDGEFAGAESVVSDRLKEAIGVAYGNIRAFHAAQLPAKIDMHTMPGVRCVQRAVPLRRVGLYIPGGSAPLFSTVLMLAVPAATAGCDEVIICTPPGRNGAIAPEILYAARLCGVKRVFKVGGAQAIAAMALGTESIPEVDKIFGPGNRYVTTAKQQLSVTDTAIDMPAGPSEVMVLADGSARPGFVAADLLSQAEHGTDSQAILVTDSADMAARTAACVEEQLKTLPRSETALKALDNSYIIILENSGDMADFATLYAPEHLIVSTASPWETAERIPTAGSVFIGGYTPESAGDYASGTNHTLPTAGWARSFSGVNTESFMRRITYQELTRNGLAALGGHIMEMARAEGLEGHARGVEVRLKNMENE